MKGYVLLLTGVLLCYASTYGLLKIVERSIVMVLLQIARHGVLGSTTQLVLFSFCPTFDALTSKDCKRCYIHMYKLIVWTHIFPIRTLVQEFKFWFKQRCVFIKCHFRRAEFDCYSYLMWLYNSQLTVHLLHHYRHILWYHHHNKL